MIYMHLKQDLCSTLRDQQKTAAVENFLVVGTLNSTVEYQFNIIWIKHSAVDTQYITMSTVDEASWEIAQRG